ncbi:acyltransferase family protein [Cognatishimia sp.]|uniref:acyltransferase family protein n=1 Tax=Cognatishimia sp. TaxID=2211648 RepID=UPI0035146C4B|nr:acyltransferase [Cognatishimia sp.]
MTTVSRLAWLDCLRLLAGVSMLILHCTADANGGAWVAYDVHDRIAPLLIRTFAYAARTELFIIISLFLLMMSLEKRPRGYRETIAEQAQRLLVPFAFWTVFYAFFSLIKAHHFGYLDAKLAALGDIRTWVSFALLGTSKYHSHLDQSGSIRLRPSLLGRSASQMIPAIPDALLVRRSQIEWRCPKSRFQR